jgi:hypothetical protein
MKLPGALDSDISHRAAIEPTDAPATLAQAIERSDGSARGIPPRASGIIEMLKPSLFEVSRSIKRRSRRDHLPRQRRHRCDPTSRRREPLLELSRLLGRLRKNGPFEIWRDEEMGLGTQRVEFGLDGFEVPHLLAA